MGRLLRRAVGVLGWTVEAAMTLLFVSLFLATMLNIVLRNVGGIAWLWIPAFTRLAFIWLVFLGIAAAYRRADHLTVDFFLHRMAPRRRTFALIAINLALVPFFLVLVRFGWNVAGVRMRIPFDTWPVPTGYAYYAVPIAAVLLLVFCAERLALLVKEVRTDEQDPSAPLP